MAHLLPSRLARPAMRWTLLLTLVLGMALTASLAWASNRRSALTVSKIKPSSKLTRKAKAGHLRLVTLNVAHGRKTGLHQYLQSKKKIIGNLNDIAKVIRREAPDVVAVQEADAPSRWSGKFHHVNYLAKAAGFSFSILGEHVRKSFGTYGTGIFARYKISNAASYIFKPAFPMPGKGFVVATIQWPGAPGLKVDLVSVHLDPLRHGVRTSQVEEIMAALRTRKNPVIIMGDFNTGWRGKSAVRHLAETYKLKTYNPYNPYLYTFPRFKTRLDWVLVSKEFEFVSFKVIQDKLSDHLGITTELRLNKKLRAKYFGPKQPNKAVKKPAPRVVKPAVRAVKVAPTTRPTTRPTAR